MKTTIKQIAKITLLLTATLSFTACTSKKAVDLQQDHLAQKEINAMEINEISSMDSGNALDGGSFIAITQVMEGLYNLDEHDAVIPGVASALPTISKDGLTYTIPLRKEATWSNGTPVTANDFVYAWQRVVDPEYGSPSAFLLSDIKNANEIIDGEKKPETLGVQALDKYTLQVTLAQPVAYFTSVMTFPTLFPINQAYAEKQGKDYALDAEHLIYNGPYQLNDWKQGDQSWVYKRNDTYWNKEASNVQKITIQVLKDTNTAYHLYQSGELDRAVLSSEYARQEKNNPEYTTQLDSWVHVLELNQHNILTNKKVRQAISQSIDREHITKTLLDNDSQPIYGLVPAEFVKNPDSTEDFRKESGDIATFNTKNAQKLWQEYLEETNHPKVTLELLASDQDENKAISEYIQYALEKNLPGMKINISMMPEKNLIDRKEQKNYDILLTRQGPDFQDPITFLNKYQTDSYDNPSNYSNHHYDERLKQAKQQATDPAARWQTLITAEQLLIEDGAVVPLYQSANTALMRPQIKGMIHHLFGPPNYYGKIMIES